MVESMGWSINCPSAIRSTDMSPSLCSCMCSRAAAGMLSLPPFSPPEQVEVNG